MSRLTVDTAVCSSAQHEVRIVTDGEQVYAYGTGVPTYAHALARQAPSIVSECREAVLTGTILRVVCDQDLMWDGPAHGAPRRCSGVATLDLSDPDLRVDDPSTDDVEALERWGIEIEREDP